jgi:hypothetical protein
VLSVTSSIDLARKRKSINIAYRRVTSHLELVAALDRGACLWHAWLSRGHWWQRAANLGTVCQVMEAALECCRSVQFQLDHGCWFCVCVCVCVCCERSEASKRGTAFGCAVWIAAALKMEKNSLDFVRSNEKSR